MRKVLLATHLSPVIHGQALMANQLAEANSLWDDLELYTLNTAYAESREGLKGGAFGKLLKLKKYLGTAQAIIEREKIDTLIVTPAFFRGPFFKDQLFLKTLKKRTGVKVFGWVHMDPARLELENLPRPLAKLALQLIKNVDHWVCCADSLSKQWPDWLTNSEGSIESIANGIADPVGKLQRISNSRKRLTYLSSMDAAKGWRDLFDVVCELCAERDDFEMNFYGGLGAGETEKEIDKIFFESGFSDRVCWHGKTWNSEKSEALSATDLFVFPSHTEQFPISILEAMAYSLPIIATDVGAVKDALPEQKLLKPGDKSQLRAAIVDFLDRSEIYQESGERNRKRFLEKFSKQAFHESWRQLLIIKQK